ncbi:MAG: hypothetical protein VB071_11895, partial [Lawsonibacter sp.]|nr:hypothetical protein [Lawsonibacter sp.]
MTDNITVTLAGSRMNLSSAFGGVTGEANATRIRLVFDESWEQLTKKVTFFDAAGENPVVRTLTTDLLEAGSTLIYLCPIPPEPLALAGEMSFVVDGWTDGVRARSLEGTLNVGYAPQDDTAGVSANPTPTQAEQLQAEIDAIKTDIVAAASAVDAKEAAKTAQAGAEVARAAAEQSAQAAAASASTAATFSSVAAGSADEAEQAKQAILSLGVQGVTLDAGGMVSVEKIVAVDESVTLKFSIPRGDKGDTGETGVTGATGPQGVSIVSVIRTSGTGAPGSTDTYTITLSNGQTSTFQVYNGADGADGEGVGDMLSSVYDPQGKAQDVFAYAAQKTHAAEHAAGGSDPVTPESIGAAEAGHTHTPASIGAAAASHSHAATDI